MNQFFIQLSSNVLFCLFCQSFHRKSFLGYSFNIFLSLSWVCEFNLPRFDNMVMFYSIRFPQSWTSPTWTWTTSVAEPSSARGPIPASCTTSPTLSFGFSTTSTWPARTRGCSRPHKSSRDWISWLNWVRLFTTFPTTP